MIRTTNLRQDTDNDFLEHDNATQVERLKALVYGQAKFLELVSSGASLTRILEAIALWVEQQSENDLHADSALEAC